MAMDDAPEIPLLGSETEFRQAVLKRILRLEASHNEMIRKMGYANYQRALFEMTKHRHKVSEIDAETEALTE
jgi:hypothetical protein